MSAHHPRHWTRPMLAAAVVGAAVAVPLLTFGTSRAQATDGTLEAFQSCDDLADMIRTRARTQLDANGGGIIVPLGAAESSAGADGALQARTAKDSFSTTNVQEAGVDEPDVVKSDGRRTFAIAQGRVYAIDAAGDRARVTGSVRLPDGVFAQEMLLSGDRLLVIGSAPIAIEPGIGDSSEPGIGDQARPDIAIYPGPSGTTFVDVDVSDMDAPAVRQTLQVDGNYVSARMRGATVRIVMGSDPMMNVALGAKDADDLREALDDADAEDFLPGFTLRDQTGATIDQGALLACASVSQPRGVSELGLMSLITMDLGQGIRPTDSDGVLANGYTVMASPDRVYVALSRMDAQERTMVAKTDVHVFDATSATQTNYRASGTISGNLLNQFAMSEFEGRLRVATTLESFPAVVGPQPQIEPAPQGEPGVSPPSDGGGAEPGASDDTSVPASTGADTPVSSDGSPVTSDGSDSSVTSVAPAKPEPAPDSAIAIAPPATESAVTVLELDGNELRQVGRVAGLGKGERIYAVRFVGPTGYVVTFRQTDPLYTVDLSDPTRPRVVGELKIPGYSAYLHPMDPTTLIGVGQDARAVGTGATIQGLQVSTFDVANPAAPRRTRVWSMPGGYSEAEYDHHAFLWWPATRTIVMPVVGTFSDRPSKLSPEAFRPTALALRIDDRGITQTAVIRHPKSDQTSIRRSMVQGDNLLTFSDAGMLVSSLDGTQARQWVAFK